MRLAFLPGALIAFALSLGAAPSAFALDVMGGVYAHGIGTKQSQEGGADIMAGLQTEKLGTAWYWPAVHGIISANTNVSTDFVAVGIDYPIGLFGSRFYVRPGIGLAYTTGKADLPSPFVAGITAAESARRLRVSQNRIDFGSNVLFEPELAFGYRINDKWRAELSYVHLSNGQILHQGKNQGLDDLGLRIAYRFR